MKGIIISGMPAVGKTTVARTIAERFDLRYYSGGDVLKEMARESGYAISGDDWWDTEDGMKFISQRKDDESFDKMVDERLLNLLEKGGIVVTSYPLPWLVKDALKIWLKASEITRAKRLSGRDTLEIKDSSKIIEKRDMENRGIYSQIYGIRFGDDLSVFDFVIATDDLSSQQVSEITISIVKQFV